MNIALEKLASSLGVQLQAQGYTLAVAESCTGGGLAYTLTSVEGSSAWFDCGFVTYSNQSKIEMLGVAPDTLNIHGAVSEQTALQMAQGAMARAKTDVSVSITGIAGPSGSTADKPVGMVCFGFIYFEQVSVRTQFFAGSRNQVRLQAINYALETLLQFSSVAVISA